MKNQNYRYNTFKICSNFQNIKYAHQKFIFQKLSHSVCHILEIVPGIPEVFWKIVSVRFASVPEFVSYFQNFSGKLSHRKKEYLSSGNSGTSNLLKLCPKFFCFTHDKIEFSFVSLYSEVKTKLNC